MKTPSSPKEYKDSPDLIQQTINKELNTYPKPFEYLTTQQAAEYLQVSTQWLEIGRVKGYGPKFIKLGRLVRYKRTSIDKFLEKHEVENTIQDGSHE